MSAIQALHDVEIGGGISWPEEGKILVYLGCPLDPPPRTRMFGEALVATFAEAEAWFQSKASEFGTTFDTQAHRQGRSVVERLFEAGVPGSVYWIYDSAFGMTLADRKAGAMSWAEAEAWLAANAPH